MLLKKPLIAIDIGTSSVKTLELSLGPMKKLKAMGVESLPPTAIVDGELRDSEAVQAVISTLLEKLGIKMKGRRTALAVGGSNVMIKKVLLDIPNKNEIAEVVFREAEQAFQHDMSELYFRYKVIGDIAVENKSLVMLVGAKRSAVDSYCAMINNLGMRVGVIDCDTFSVSNMFEYNYQLGETVAVIVNIGAATTQMILVQGGRILYNREISQGGDQYNHRLANELGVDLENAESLKISAALSEDPGSKNVLQIINEVNESLVADIEQSIAYYYQNEDPMLLPPRPEYVFICGGGARVAGIDTTIATHLQMKVQILNPFRRVDVRSSGVDLGFIMSAGPAYAVAVGLGLRQFKDSDD